VEAEARCGGCGSEEHGSRRRREVGEVVEGGAVLRRSGFILFRRTLVGASSAATGAAATTTTTVTAKTTTRGEPIAGLLENVQEGGAPFHTRCGKDARTEREGASERRGGGGEIYPMGRRKGRRKTHAPGVSSALRVEDVWCGVGGL